jgi:hypothetical protein
MRAKWAYVLIGASLAFGAGAGEAPSSDFLEFLGNGAQLGGQWIDPMSMHDSPEVFAGMPTAKDDSKQRNKSNHREDVAPAKDTSTPPRNDDGGN